MKASMGIKEIDFAILHDKIKEQVISAMENSDRIKSKKCMQMFLKQLDTEVEVAYCELCDELLKQLQDMKNKRQAAKNDALRVYNDSMNKLFQDASQSPIEDLKLESRHQYAECEAENVLKSFFEDLHSNYRVEDEEQIILMELSEEILHRLNSFQENNQLRWDKFESECRNNLAAIKEHYATTLRSAIEESFDEEEFAQRVAEAKSYSKSSLRQGVDTNLAKPDFFESLQQELCKYLEIQFDNSLQVFTMKQEEDKIQVRAAFAECKNYYNDEMDKITKEQDWYPPEVLEQKSQEKMDDAVERCKDEVELTDHQEKQLREHIKNLFVKYWNDNLKRYPRDSYSVGIDLGRDRNSNDEFKKRKAFARLGRIRHYCEQQKRLLSSANRIVISIDRIDDNYDLEVDFTRELFEDLNMARFQECINLMRDTLKESKLDKANIDDIVLVGGSTRIPKIREMIREFFNNRALNIRINPDEAVARGAAVQAALLNGKQALDLAAKLTVSDVAPLSVGVEVVSGALSVVIPKNTTVPCMRRKFLLSNIPKARRGEQPIDINMSVDAEGILHVQAVSRKGRSTNSIDIETYNGRMTNSDISKAR
ncbi:unnamed protein product, partial [Allacma fusca]